MGRASDPLMTPTYSYNFRWLGLELLVCYLAHRGSTGVFRLLQGPHPLGPIEIDGLLVLPGKTYTLLTDHLITGKPIRFEPAQEKWFRSNHLYKYKPLWLKWMAIFLAFAGCHG